MVHPMLQSVRLPMRLPMHVQVFCMGLPSWLGCRMLLLL